MTRELKVYIDDILESLDIVIGYVKDIDEEEFNSSIQLQDAVIRRFEIIGEAAKQVPDSFRNKHPHIPWRCKEGARQIKWKRETLFSIADNQSECSGFCLPVSFLICFRHPESD